MYTQEGSRTSAPAPRSFRRAGSEPGRDIAGAYWRGDEHNRSTAGRIYGTAFEKQADLDAYLHMLEEAKKRDHRKLGKRLGLFSLHEEGQGFPFFHPNGMVI